MSDPCRLVETTQKQTAYAMGYIRGEIDGEKKLAAKILPLFCACCNQEACSGGMAGTIQECSTIRILNDVITDALNECEKEGD